MGKSIFWSGSLIFILLCMLLGGKQALAQTEDSASNRKRYFPETGHLVSGDFLVTYESATNPELIYGNPITEVFERDFRIIQYFEKARFELHPENPPELRVEITPLGYMLHESSPSLANPGYIPGCRFFPEARFYVCYDFLEFFNANGGAAQFGYPISNFEIRNGRMVQHFQRARFEWHPELPSGQQIRLADLGKEYFALIGENPVRLLPVPPEVGGETIEDLVKDLRVRTYFDKSVTHPSDKQTIFVIVQDQKLDTVEDAVIQLEILLPSGITLKPEVLTTNKHRFSEHTFSFTNQPTGKVKVKITTIYRELSEKTTASFLIWR